MPHFVQAKLLEPRIFQYGITWPNCWRLIIRGRGWRKIGLETVQFKNRAGKLVPRARAFAGCMKKTVMIGWNEAGKLAGKIARLGRRYDLVVHNLNRFAPIGL